MFSILSVSFVPKTVSSSLFTLTLKIHFVHLGLQPTDVVNFFTPPPLKLPFPPSNIYLEMHGVSIDLLPVIEYFCSTLKKHSHWEKSDDKNRNLILYFKNSCGVLKNKILGLQFLVLNCSNLSLLGYELKSMTMFSFSIYFLWDHPIAKNSHWSRLSCLLRKHYIFFFTK